MRAGPLSLARRLPPEPKTNKQAVPLRRHVPQTGKSAQANRPNTEKIIDQPPERSLKSPRDGLKFLSATPLRWRLVTVTVLHRSTSNDESGDGLCLSKIGRDRVEPLRRFTRFLPWSEAASRASDERPGSLWHDAVVASLLLGAVFGRLPKGSGFQNGLLSKVGRLFGWFVPRGFPRTNHPLASNWATNTMRKHPFRPRQRKFSANVQGQSDSMKYTGILSYFFGYW